LVDGFKTAINTGKGGGQLVFHLHVHVLGGGKLAHI
jgi:histidine triad (HIT) family protein